MTTTSISDEKILTAAKSLPVAPQIMARLHKMLLDSNSGLPEIATLLKRDVSLTTRIIRIANSPAYKGGGLGTIEEALQRVGFGEVVALLEARLERGCVALLREEEQPELVEVYVVQPLVQRRGRRQHLGSAMLYSHPCETH